jgi:hypothetical protein
VCLVTAYCSYHVRLSPWLRLGSRHNNIVIAGDNNCFDESTRQVNENKETKNCRQEDHQLKWLHLQAQEEADQPQGKAKQGKEVQHSQLYQRAHPEGIQDQNQGHIHLLEALQYFPQQTPTHNSKKHS